MAVKNAQFQVASASKQLDAGRLASGNSTQNMLNITKALGDVMGQIAGLDMQRVDVRGFLRLLTVNLAKWLLEHLQWEKIRTILIQAIAFICQFKGCLSDLVHPFSAVNTTVKVSMDTTLQSCIDLINNSSKDARLAGISLSNFGKQVSSDRSFVL